MNSLLFASLAKIPQQNVHGHFAGYLARRLAAHAVTNHKDAVARVITEVVFVILAHASNVSFSGNFHCKRHASSCSACSRIINSVSCKFLLQKGEPVPEEDGADCTRIIYYLAIRELPAYMNHAARGLDKSLLANMMAGLFLIDH